MSFVPRRVSRNIQGKRQFLPGLLQEVFCNGVGKMDFLTRLQRLRVGNAKHMPQAVRVLNEAMIIYIPMLFFADARIVDFYKFTAFNQGSWRGIFGQGQTRAKSTDKDVCPKIFHDWIFHGWFFNSSPPRATLA